MADGRRHDWIDIEKLAKLVDALSGRKPPPTEGGQGSVIRVLNGLAINKDAAFELKSALGGLRDGEDLLDVLLSIAPLDWAMRPQNWAALKSLNYLKAPEAEAKERLRREVAVYQKIAHGNLLKVLDSNVDEGWMVTQYHPRGTLAAELRDSTHRGDALGAIGRILPLVDAVAHLHEQNVSHRDIKPENIFVSDQGGLILGDAGLATPFGGSLEGLTVTGAHIGSWPWSPTWTYHDSSDTAPNVIDCYALMMILRCMVAGTAHLDLARFFAKPRGLALEFPGKGFEPLDAMLRENLVQNQDDVKISSARELHRILTELRRQLAAPTLANDPVRRCMVCRDGFYNTEGSRSRRILGLTEWAWIHAYSCSACGHVQLFSEKQPAAWGPTVEVPPNF